MNMLGRVARRRREKIELPYDFSAPQAVFVLKNHVFYDKIDGESPKCSPAAPLILIPLSFYPPLFKIREN